MLMVYCFLSITPRTQSKHEIFEPSIASVVGIGRLFVGGGINEAPHFVLVRKFLAFLFAEISEHNQIVILLAAAFCNNKFHNWRNGFQQFQCGNVAKIHVCPWGGEQAGWDERHP